MKLSNAIIGPLKMEPEDNVYFVSDLHLNHNKEFLYGSRHFESITKHDEYMFYQLRALAYSKENISLISLGDNCFNDSSTEILTKFSQLPFRAIYSLGGNHCSGLNTAFKDTNNFHYNNLYLLGSNIPFLLPKKMKRYLVLSHFPILEYGTDCFGCLCGHCHGKNKHLNENSSTYGRIFDCGVDNALRLYNRPYFSLNECLNILQSKTPKPHNLTI